MVWIVALLNKRAFAAYSATTKRRDNHEQIVVIGIAFPYNIWNYYGHDSFK